MTFAHSLLAVCYKTEDTVCVAYSMLLTIMILFCMKFIMNKKYCNGLVIKKKKKKFQIRYCDNLVSLCICDFTEIYHSSYL